MNVLWLQSGGCGGCSMSLLCADTTDFQGHLQADAGVHLLWHPSLSLASGDEVLALLQARSIDGRHHSWTRCVSKARCCVAPTAPGAFHMLAGTGLPMIHWVRELAAKAQACAGRLAAARPGAASRPPATTRPTPAACSTKTTASAACWVPTSARGSGLPVINVAGCPTHPSWVIDTLMALAADSLGHRRRPGPAGATALATPTSWCTMAARATSTTSSRPAPRSRRTWAA